MSTSPETRASLLVRLRQHDDVAAWGEFVEIYQPLILRMAQRSGLQEADANEVLQEVLTRVARAVPTWQDSGHRGSFRSWLARVTRNLVIQFFRDRRRWPRTSDHSGVRRLVEGQADPRDDDQWFDLELQRQHFVCAARRIRDRFEPATWQAFWRTAVENEPIDEVARQLGMTRGAIYIARSRVMSQLRRAVERQLLAEEQPPSRVD
jgi:RNA polymerase sigma-70 factor (ECF subfamily)